VEKAEEDVVVAMVMRVVDMVVRAVEGDMGEIEVAVMKVVEGEVVDVSVVVDEMPIHVKAQRAAMLVKG
jgi:hypothetical protein